MILVDSIIMVYRCVKLYPHNVSFTELFYLLLMKVLIWICSSGYTWLAFVLRSVVYCILDSCWF